MVPNCNNLPSDIQIIPSFVSGGITGRQINFMMIKEEVPCRVLTFDDKTYSVQ